MQTPLARTAPIPDVTVPILAFILAPGDFPEECPEPPAEALPGPTGAAAPAVWPLVDLSLRKALANLPPVGERTPGLAVPGPLPAPSVPIAPTPPHTLTAAGLAFLRQGEREALARDLAFPSYFEDLAQLPRGSAK